MNERMNAYIFNDKYQIVNITGQIADEKDGKLIILSDNEISYSIPYIGPEELVKMSVDELEGYKPSEAIMMKYNIGSDGK